MSFFILFSKTSTDNFSKSHILFSLRSINLFMADLTTGTYLSFAINLLFNKVQINVIIFK